jgi:hypothetical protein
MVVPMPMIVAMRMTMRIIRNRLLPATDTRTDENLRPRPVMVMPAITRPRVPAVEPTTRELVPAVSKDWMNFLGVSLSWGAPEEDVADYDEDRTAEGYHRRRIAQGYEEANHHDGEGEVPAPLEHGPCAGHFGGFQSFQACFSGLEVNLKPYGKVVEDGWKDSHDHDGAVGGFGDGGQDEGRGAHDGGKETAAGGGRRLHRSREFLGIAHFLHHWDRESPVATTLATGLPEMDPKMAEPMTEMRAGPRAPCRRRRRPGR